MKQCQMSKLKVQMKSKFQMSEKEFLAFIVNDLSKLT
jgi:hypothetical protein